MECRLALQWFCKLRVGVSRFLDDNDGSVMSCFGVVMSSPTADGCAEWLVALLEFGNNFDILKMMANLRFIEAEIGELDSLNFEDEHQVEGSESWLLRVDFGKPNHGGARHNKPGIVLTKRDVVDAKNSPTMGQEVGAFIPQIAHVAAANDDRGKGLSVDDTKGCHFKRSHDRKENKGSLVIKKACPGTSASTNIVEDEIEDTLTRKVLKTMEVGFQPH
ncbi:hypothetical protein V6N11_031657 [Hibiscus sabdariffa]|uniref:Uncharacterized protein n=1 Tax=Hibiscus sabdariffa TaxID=183260 RepID=A0ABR2SYL2_9ROSI